MPIQQLQQWVNYPENEVQEMGIMPWFILVNVIQHNCWSSDKYS